MPSATATAGLTGQEQELGALVTALETPGVLCLTGPGGVGKARLAHAAMTALASPETGTPVWLCDASGGIDAASARVRQLLLSRPDARVLVTGPRPLGIPGERVLRLTPLTTPHLGTGPSGGANESPAMRLLLERARTAAPALVPALVWPHLHRICALSGGLPHVLGLAAEQLARISPELLARAMETPNALAVLSPPDGSGLREVLETGWAQLSRDACTVLEQASIFEGQVQLDAVAAVVHPPLSSAELLNAVAELIEAQLVQEHADHRFSVLTPMRWTGQARLDEAGTLTEVRQRHAAYFRARCREGNDTIVREWPDVVAMLDHLIGTGSVDDMLVHQIAQVPEVNRTLTSLPGTAASASSENPMARARTMIWQLLGDSGDADAAAEVTVFGRWAAHRVATRLATARLLGDESALLHALELPIRGLNLTLDLAAAVAASYEGMELARRRGDVRALGRFEAWVAMALSQRDNNVEAGTLAASALRHARETGDALAMINAQRVLTRLPEALRPSYVEVGNLHELLETTQLAGEASAEITVLAKLVEECLSQADPRAAAVWNWRQLVMAADRTLTEPLSTLPAVISLVSVAHQLGDRATAASLRGSIAVVEPLIDTFLLPVAARRYRDTCADLDTAPLPVPPQPDSAAGLLAINRRAQLAAQRLCEPPAVTPATGLTPRELEVLRALASGGTNAQIAHDLGVTTKTVMHHSVAIYRKLGLRGRAAATAWAFQNGVLDGTPV